MKAIGNKVIIKVKEQTEATFGGIYIPSAANKELTATGEILSVGAEVKDISVGDTVLFFKGGVAYNGTEKVTIIKDSEILAVL